MKRTKAIARQALLAAALLLMVLSLAACSGKKESGSASASPQVEFRDDIDEDEYGTGWPSSSLLSKYGIDGLSQPSGISDIKWETSRQLGNPVLFIRFTGTDADSEAIRDWFSGNGWGLDSQAVTRNNYAKGNLRAGADWRPDDKRGELVMMIKEE